METINLNGKEYISKEEYEKLDKILKEPIENKMAKRFNQNQTTKLIKALSQLFDMASESISEELFMQKDILILDPANVCGVEGKTEEAKRLLTLFYYFENKDKKKPELNHEAKAKEICSVKLSLEYVQNIINVLKITDEAVKITTKNDYPAYFENKDFKFVMAPRIEQDE